MYQTVKSKKIRIGEVIAPKLGFRDSAVDFFKEIESISADEIEIDFTGVTFISRSFAHEYIMQKKRSNKEIKEINMSESIEKMFKIVLNSKNRNKKINITPRTYCLK
jgi:hypothetical protein